MPQYASLHRQPVNLFLAMVDRKLSLEPWIQHSVRKDIVGFAELPCDRQGGYPVILPETVYYHQIETVHFPKESLLESPMIAVNPMPGTTAGSGDRCVHLPRFARCFDGHNLNLDTATLMSVR